MGGGGKIIHDPLLGTNFFEAHEIAIIDTPLLQRLRSISQTGLAYLVYPGARHSRFEHSLGTVALVERYVRALQAHARPDAPVIQDVDRWELRLAALLHDVGHAFFSHSSEALYRHLPEMAAYRRALGLSKGAGELVSQAIIQTLPFRKFFDTAVRGLTPQPRLDHVAAYIVGSAPEPERRFLADMISGPLDVDKLDYIHRDGYATGLRLVVDLERFFSAVDVRRVAGAYRIVIRAPEPLEQIMFSKMMLFATVYHHHKVKACDCLLDSAVRSGTGRLADLAHIVDYLDRTDASVLEDDANPYMRRLRFRDLPYRAAVLARETVSDGWKVALHELQKVADEPDQRRAIQEAIWEELPRATRQALPISEVWFTLPEPAHLQELELAFILRPGDEIVQAQEVVPTQGWLDAYKTYKSRGHVFAPKPFVRDVFTATERLLGKRYDLRFKPGLVGKLCHWG